MPSPCRAKNALSSKILRKYEQVISNSLLATYPKHATQTNHLQQQALMLLDCKKKEHTYYTRVIFTITILFIYY